MTVFNQLSLPINNIREWCFCPRVVYYQELLNLQVDKPLWLQQGQKAHDTIEMLEKRRNYSRYGIDHATRHFNIALHSPTWQIHGVADWVLEKDNEIFVVEYKTNPKPQSLGHKLQLCAYAVCAQEQFNKICHTGFIAGEKKVYSIDITETLKNSLHTTIQSIQSMLKHGNKPDTCADLHQCASCQYLNYCNDRL